MLMLGCRGGYFKGEPHLKHDVSTHGFAMCYNGLITRPIPAVQFNAPLKKEINGYIQFGIFHVI